MAKYNLQPAAPITRDDLVPCRDCHLEDLPGRMCRCCGCHADGCCQCSLTLSEAPVVELANGIRVANFSSGHEFYFQHGRTLPPCQADRVSKLSLEPSERELLPNGRWKDIVIEFKITQVVLDELIKLNGREDIDIIMVPRIVMDALKAKNLPVGKCRTGRRLTRQTTTDPGVWRDDTFCT